MNDSKSTSAQSLDLEIKHAQLIFNRVWKELEKKERGLENLHSSKELILPGGAPRSGKGTNTAFICEVRGGHRCSDRDATRFFPNLRSGHQLFQRPSPKKQISSNQATAAGSEPGVLITMIASGMKALLLCLLLCVPAAPSLVAASADGCAVRELKTDYRVNPLGLDRLPPALSWQMAGARPGAAQSAYRIVAAATEKELAAGEYSWDSGKVASDRSTQVAYAGPLPKAGERILWQVRTWDENGKEGDWSEPAWFEAGLLNEAGWQGAKWMGSSQNYKAPTPVPAELMGAWISCADEDLPVSRFFVDVNLPDKPVVSAMIHGGAGAGGSFPVVNYNQVAPYYQDSMGRVGKRPDAFVDMATLMMPGKSNRIELQLRKPAAKAVCSVGIRIVFADGTEMKVASGPAWQAGAEKAVKPVKVVAAYGDSKYGLVRQLAQTSLPPTWFRKTVTVRTGLVRARLYCCALGQGLTYLNGKPVDEVFFSSPQSDYEEFGYYTAHDIAGLLHPGENALAVLLDGGWYHQVGGFGWVFSYGQPGIKALVQLEYADGTTERILSGPDWQWKEGAVREANIYRGEKIDYRLDHDEWKSPEAGSGWQPARIIPPCTPTTVGVDVNPVRAIREIKPVKSWQVGSQTWLFDIGEMTHGVVRLKFNEAAGKTIRLCYSEYAEDGKLMNVPLSHWMCHGVMQQDELIADGNSRTYQSQFTAKSFRFVEVSGLTRPPQPGDLIAISVHTDAEVLTTFESSDPMLNRLYQNGVRTFQNYVNHVTGDIPRERCLWGAESIYSIIPATYCFDWAPNHRLMNTLWWTGAMTKDGIPGQIGVGKRLTTMTQSFIWSATPLFLTSELAEFYGDTSALRTYYDKALHFVRFFERTAEDGIPTPNLLADHAATPNVPRAKQDSALINAMLFFEIENRFARMADQLGKTDDAAHARSYAEIIRSAVMKRYDPVKHTFGNGTQDSLALAYGLISDPVEAKALAASLVGYYRANGHQFDGGFMSYEIYPMLSKYGYVEDAYAMLVNPDYAGPAWSVKTYDATTFYELYTLDRDQQMKVGQNFMAYAHSIGWMITDLAGIRYVPGAPNGKKLLLAPQVPQSGRLKQIAATLQTPMGKVPSAWTYQDGLFDWVFTVPANVSAEVRVPTTNAQSVTGTEQMKRLRTEAGVVIYEASAGSYSVQSRLPQSQPVAVKAKAKNPIAIPPALKQLALPVEMFKVDGDVAFVLAATNASGGKPWVWYAPTLDQFPNQSHAWYFERLLKAGISVAGINLGEVRGAPASTERFIAFHQEMVRRGYSSKPILLGQSRGGLMLLAWAMRHPDQVKAFAGIYPVCNLASWPLIKNKTIVLKDYGMTEAKLLADLKTYNPIDNLAGLLSSHVPLFIVHGNADQLVPYKENGRLLKERYEAAGGRVEVKMIQGGDHEVTDAFFKCPELLDFITSQSKD